MNKGKKRRIAILTGGGDCPGINAVIRAITKKAILEHDMEIIGIKDGYEGLIDNQYRTLNFDDVSGILTLGGTILGTSKKANPFQYAVNEGDGDKLKFEDLSAVVLKNIEALKIECLVCIGGDGTLWISNRFHKLGVPIIGVPKTIDNDIKGTDITFGFDSAVNIATEAIDRIHTTEQSHHRIMLVEVMGHKAGWIALHSGIAGGGDVILIPEIPYHSEKIVDYVLQRRKTGRRFSIIAVAEGSKPVGGEVVIKRIVKESSDPIRLGGISFVLGEELGKMSGLETRSVVLGHLQRGGTPTPFDRVLATRLGSKAVDLIIEKNYGKMVSVRGDHLEDFPLEEVATGPRLIPADYELIKAAREIGVCFGD
ncbi:MAG TPA: ATP-dependent 6-phosphofructokinase [Atribacterota bacterium]|nr:ATP-dependent 6-phosphofructokinase [Atribacterota bacterium]